MNFYQDGQRFALKQLHLEKFAAPFNTANPSSLLNRTGPGGTFPGAPRTENAYRPVAPPALKPATAPIAAKGVNQPAKGPPTPGIGAPPSNTMTKGTAPNTSSLVKAPPTNVAGTRNATAPAPMSRLTANDLGVPSAKPGSVPGADPGGPGASSPITPTPASPATVAPTPAR